MPMKKLGIYLSLLSFFIIVIFIPCSQTKHPKLPFPKVATVTFHNKVDPVVDLIDKTPLDPSVSGIDRQPLPVILQTNPNQKRNIPVLMYHSISKVPGNYLCVPPDKFEEHIKTILHYGFTPITATTYLSYMEKGNPLPKNPILITFDDGYQDNFDKAFPIIKKYNVKITLFMIAGAINKSKRMLSSDEILQMEHSGLVDFESHTFHHPHLAKLSPEEANQELLDSKKVLQRLLKKEIRVLGYPYGDYSQTVVKLVHRDGYSIAFCSDPGPANYLNQQAYLLHRFTAYPDRPLTFLLKFQQTRY